MLAVSWTVELPQVHGRNVREVIGGAEDAPRVEGHQQTQVTAAKEAVKALVDAGAIRFGEQDFCTVLITGIDDPDADSVTITVARTDPPA